MSISRSDAITFLLFQKREKERAAREARERGGTDHTAEAHAQQFSDIADLLSENVTAEVT